MKTEIVQAPHFFARGSDCFDSGSVAVSDVVAAFDSQDDGVPAVVRIAHYAIRETRIRLRMARMMSGEGFDDEQHAVSVGESLLADFDDWRGVRASKWPWPRPEQIHAQDLLEFAAVFRRAAATRGPLQPAFHTVVERAYSCGLEQLQKTRLQ